MELVNGNRNTERIVIRIWQDVLQETEIGPESDFFALGGRSLLAMKVVVGVRNETGAAVTLADIFRSPLLREFVKLVDAKRGVEQ